MRKILLLGSYLIVFTFGFFVDTFLESKGVGLENVEQKILDQKIEPISGEDQFMTYVDFEKGKFSQSAVKVRKGDYLAVTNKDVEKQMWLTATMSAWTTPRGFAEGERVMQTMNEVGNFSLREKASGAVLLIEVY